MFQNSEIVHHNLLHLFLVNRVFTEFMYFPVLDVNACCLSQRSCVVGFPIFERTLALVKNPLFFIFETGLSLDFDVYDS